MLKWKKYLLEIFVEFHEWSHGLVSFFVRLKSNDSKPMNGILILAEDIISVAGGRLAIMLVSSQNWWLFVGPLSGGTILTWLPTFIRLPQWSSSLPLNSLKTISILSSLLYLRTSQCVFVSLFWCDLIWSALIRSGAHGSGESVGVTRLAGVSALTVFSGRPFYLYLCLSVSQSQYAARTPTDRFFSPALC